MNRVKQFASEILGLSLSEHMLKGLGMIIYHQKTEDNAFKRRNICIFKEIYDRSTLNDVDQYFASPLHQKLWYVLATKTQFLPNLFTQTTPERFIGIVKKLNEKCVLTKVEISINFVRED